jgi:glycosyltransferase involved in cell wall biosynthesis
MKILHVVHGFPPETHGGTESVVEALARAMQRGGHEVHVLAGSLRVGPPERVEREDHAGLPVLRLHRDDLYFESWWKAYHPGVSAAFSAVLDELRLDVVHVHHWLRLSSDLARRARAAGCVVAITCHDYFSVLAQPVRLVGETKIAPPPHPPYVNAVEAAEALAFHRRDFADDLRAAHLRFAPSAAQCGGILALAGADVGTFTPLPPPHLGQALLPLPATQPRGRRLLTWGSLYPEKGITTVLAALARTDRALGWTLTVLGEAHDPAFAATLREQAQALPVTWRGRFTRDDLQQAAADYALLPSLADESYGLVFDEAMQLGLPTLASDVPAYRERAQPGCAAFYPPGDAGALAALLAQPGRLESLTRPRAPAVATAALAAGELVRRYEAVRGAPAAFLPAVADADRVRLLFARAERRTWTALQQATPPVPPF